MLLSDRVLGTGIAKQLRGRPTAALLQIGSDVFTRHDLAAVDYYSFTAAANLSAILNRELKVINTRDVFENVSPAELALPRLGAISIAVLGACFEKKGLGGDAPLEAWVRRHAAVKDAAIRTFVSLKHREDVDRAEERKRLRDRKAGRRDHAHRLRVVRHMKRAGKAS